MWRPKLTMTMQPHQLDIQCLTVNEIANILKAFKLWPPSTQLPATSHCASSCRLQVPISMLLAVVCVDCAQPKSNVDVTASKWSC